MAQQMHLPYPGYIKVIDKQGLREFSKEHRQRLLDFGIPKKTLSNFHKNTRISLRVIVSMIRAVPECRYDMYWLVDFPERLEPLMRPTAFQGLPEKHFARKDSKKFHRFIMLYLSIQKEYEGQYGNIAREIPIRLSQEEDFRKAQWEAKKKALQEKKAKQKDKTTERVIAIAFIVFFFVYIVATIFNHIY